MEKTLQGLRTLLRISKRLVSSFPEFGRLPEYFDRRTNSAGGRLAYCDTENTTSAPTAHQLGPVQYGAKAVTFFEQALSSPYPKIRLAALQALSRLGGEARPAVPAIKRALADTNALVKAAAARALDKIGSSRTSTP